MEKGPSITTIAIHQVHLIVLAKYMTVNCPHPRFERLYINENNHIAMKLRLVKSDI